MRRTPGELECHKTRGTGYMPDVSGAFGTMMAGGVTAKTTSAWSGGIVLAMFVLSAWAWQRVPADVRVAVHFGFDGTPDRWAGRAEAFLVLPLIAALTTALLAVVPRIDPRGARRFAEGSWYSAITLAVVVLLASAHVAIVESAFTGIARPGTFIAIPLSGLCLVLGRFLGRSRSNFFVGVRTPWTLSSEYSWRRSNALAGRGFMLSGVAGLATLALFGAAWAMRAVVGGMIATALVSAVASYVFWRDDPGR